MALIDIYSCFPALASLRKFGTDHTASPQIEKRRSTARKRCSSQRMHREGVPGSRLDLYSRGHRYPPSFSPSDRTYLINVEVYQRFARSPRKEVRATHFLITTQSRQNASKNEVPSSTYSPTSPTLQIGIARRTRW